MANNATVTLTFKVAEDGSLKLATGNINKAAKATDELTASQKRATKAGKDHNYTMNSGVTGAASSGRSFSKLAQTINGGDNSLVAAYAGLAANAFAVSAAFTALSNAAQATQLMAGLEAQGAKAGKTLSLVSDNIKELTFNSISSVDAMRAATQGTTSGISTADIEKLTKVAYEASLALGRDVPDSLNRMMLAVTKMEPELVDELGLTTKITEASERYARQNNITVDSMTQMQRQQALLNAWVEQGTLKFGGLSESVDPNPYNQLAATFNDLVKSGLNVINFFLSPLVSLLSSSQGLLLSFGLLFLGTIKGQIVPGIQTAASEAANLAESNKKQAVKELASVKTVEAGKRKEINEYIIAAKQGIATQKQYDDAKLESDARIQAIEDRNYKDSARKEKALASERAQREKLISVQKLQSSVILEQTKARGYEAAADVDITNAKQKLGATLNAMGASFEANYRASRNSEKGLTGLANTAKASAAGIAAAGKVAAIGFLNFIPVIGQIVAITSILWSLWDSFISPAIFGTTKELTKAFEDFNTVIESTSDKVKALEKIQLSSASASDRAIAIVQNQTSTIYELAEAYTKVYEEAKRAREEEEKQEGRSTESRVAPETRQLAERLGVSAESQAFAAFQREARISPLIREAGTDEAAKVLEELEKQLPKVAKAFYDTYGGAEAFNKLPIEEKLAAVNSIGKNVATTLRKVEEAFTALGKASSELSTGYTDFIRSLTPTTPYDTILTKFSAFNSAIKNTSKAIADAEKAGTSTEGLRQRMAETISGVSGDVRRVFTLDVQADLSAFDSLDTRLQALKQEQDEYAKGTADWTRLEREIVPIKSQHVDLATSLQNRISVQTKSYQKQLEQAQISNILSQAAIGLAQAQLNLIQKRGIVTAEDARKQMNAENAIIALQIKQIEAQKVFLELDLQAGRNRIEKLETELAFLEVLKKQTEAVRETVLLAEEFRLQRMLSISPEDPNLLARLRTTEAAKEDISATIAQIEDGIDAEKRANAVREAARAALAAQQRQLAMSMNTAADIAKAEAERELDNDRAKYAIQKNINELQETNNQLNLEFLNIVSRGSRALSTQLNTIRETARIRRQQIDEETDFAKRAIQINLDYAIANRNSSQIQYFGDLLKLETQRGELAVKEVELTEFKDRLALVAIKSLEEENELKKKSLELSERLLSATVESMRATADLNAARMDLQIRRRGVTDTQAAEDIRSIQAARDQYTFAQAEVALKTQLINLEFQLLDAQRKQTIADLRLRQITLRELEAKAAQEVEDSQNAVTAASAAAAAAPTTVSADGSNDIVVIAREAQSGLTRNQELLDGIRRDIVTTGDSVTSLEAISSVAIAEAQEASIATLATRAEIARVNLEAALTPGPAFSEGFATQFANMSLIVENFNTRLEQIRKFNKANIDTPNFIPIPEPEKALLAVELFTSSFEKMKETLMQLGPQGEIVVALGESAKNISRAFIAGFRTMADENSTTTQKIVAGLEIASQMIGAVQSILSSASNARIANIDKEIAAEEKRDGKSKESLARLEAMEKKKDSIARKQFNTNKKLMMAQAVISTAAGVANALATPAPYPIPVILAGMIGALGAAQLGIIASTQYESTMSPKAVSAPSSLSIGKRGDSVNLASGANANAGGEVGYLRGAQGTGTNASNYRTIGSAYGGADLMRGYGNRGFVVGEKGPERIDFDTPISVTPANDMNAGQPLNATFNIQALDASGVEDILVGQKGNIIKMLRDAANASGQGFMEDVNVNVYTRPNVGRL